VGIELADSDTVCNFIFENYLLEKNNLFSKERNIMARIKVGDAFGDFSLKSHTEH